MSFLPSVEIEYLKNKNYEFNEVDCGSQKGLILRNFPLPSDRFDAVAVDVLILIPAGFPDIGSDMFYTFPWVKFSQSGQFPKAADQPLQFDGITWQRWSRHSKDWRSGRDGIRTVLKRIQHAIEVAQP